MYNNNSTQNEHQGSGLIAIFNVFAFVFFILLAPFILTVVISENLPSPLSEIFLVVSWIMVWPAVLCWLYSRKLFSKGRGSVIFWIYLLLYVAIGAFLTKINIGGGTAVESEGVSNANLIIEQFGGLSLVLVSVFMFFWARRENKRYRQRIQNDIAAGREDQISIQTEAILRAESIKNKQKL